MPGLQRRGGASRGVESIAGLAYEFTGDAAHDREMVRRFAGRYGIDYELLLAGISDNTTCSKLKSNR